MCRNEGAGRLPLINLILQTYIIFELMNVLIIFLFLNWVSAGSIAVEHEVNLLIIVKFNVFERNLRIFSSFLFCFVSLITSSNSICSHSYAFPLLFMFKNIFIFRAGVYVAQSNINYVNLKWFRPRENLWNVFYSR